MTDRGGPRLRGDAPRRSGDSDYPDDRYSATRAGDDYRDDRYPDDERYGRRETGSHQPLRAQWDPTSREPGRPRAPRPERQARKQSKLGKFVSVYGWRAYAIPILLVVTVLVAVDAIRGGGSSPESETGDGPGLGALSTATDGTDVIGVPPQADGNFAVTIPSGALPDGGPFTAQGAGTWHVIPGGTGQAGQGTEQVFTYTVEVEDGVDTSGFGGDEAFGRMVDQTLANPKSWTKDQRFAVRRIDSGEPSFRVSLTSQMTVRQACGYDIELEVSCYNPSINRVVLNEPRWVRGAISFQGDIGSYRQYQINHEVGHAIGYQDHQPCESDGGLAPVMMQQTFGTSNNDIAKLDPEGVVPMDGKTCRFNPWPHPRG
ncbi:MULTISPECIES: DUF3152 domain-containing protein [unclassified Rhodococcus (in: high G+C Gram-positive bacteria)]|uniref:DUF3152 domain-containing protein n=1 Tax=unclassified Rhodococcus (in: high G+C Gram-positive bacteria) TaxID=192944 RepID=UPI000BE31301|nr:MULTISPECIES: DUF3152 domain-containing protein [unclassified Rhodococcus (in: high G+C Gram-positive bacteria)]